MPTNSYSAITLRSGRSSRRGRSSPAGRQHVHIPPRTAAGRPEMSTVGQPRREHGPADVRDERRRVRPSGRCACRPRPRRACPPISTVGDARADDRAADGRSMSPTLGCRWHSSSLVDLHEAAVHLQDAARLEARHRVALDRRLRPPRSVSWHARLDARSVRRRSTFTAPAPSAPWLDVASSRQLDVAGLELDRAGVACLDRDVRPTDGAICDRQLVRRRRAGATPACSSPVAQCDALGLPSASVNVEPMADAVW